MAITEEEFFEKVEAQHKFRLSLMRRPEKSRSESGSKDRLRQFTRISAFRMCEDASVPLDLCVKQFSDILDMVTGRHPKAGDISYLRELIADVQNYLDISLVLAEVSDHEYGH